MAKSFEHKENTGSLFTNEHKKQDAHPDYTGQVNIGGELFRVAGWDNEYGDDGTRIALKFETEEEFQSRKDKGGNGGKSGGARSSGSGGNSRRPRARR